MCVIVNRELSTHDNPRPVQLEKGMRVEEFGEIALVPGEQGQEVVVVNIARGDEQQPRRTLPEFKTRLEIGVLGHQDPIFSVRLQK